MSSLVQGHSDCTITHICITLVNQSTVANADCCPVTWAWGSWGPGGRGASAGSSAASLSLQDNLGMAGECAGYYDYIGSSLGHGDMVVLVIMITLYIWFHRLIPCIWFWAQRFCPSMHIQRLILIHLLVAMYACMYIAIYACMYINPFAGLPSEFFCSHVCMHVH